MIVDDDGGQGQRGIRVKRLWIRYMVEGGVVAKENGHQWVSMSTNVPRSNY